MEFPRIFGSRLTSNLEATNPSTMTFRPLSYGMDTVHPRSLVKLRQLLNAYAAEDGWKQRPALKTLFTTIPLATGEVITDFVDMGVISSLYGSFVAIGTSYIYASQDGVLWTRCPWKKDHYVATTGTGTTAVVGTAGTTFQTDLVAAGMTVVFKDGSGDYTIEREIASVTDETNLVLTEALPTLSSMDFRIYWEFEASDPYTVQWTKGPDRIYLVDTSDLGIFEFDGMYLSRLDLHDSTHVSDTPPFSGAASIIYAQGYLVVGNVNTTNGYRSIYWSEVTDISNFHAINYVVLTLSAGPIFALKTIENYLVATTQDDVYVGKPYSGGDLAYVMPWIFKRLETSGRVPVGQQAIISALNAIFYIGQDDIYALSFAALNAQGDFIVTPMECPVRNEALTGDTHKALIMYEPTTECLLIAPTIPFNILWVMNVRTKGWSRWNLNQDMLSMARTFFAPRETYTTMLIAARVPTPYGSWATSKLEADRTGNFSAGDTVTLDTKTYTWASPLTSPAVEGEVLLGDNYAESLEYLAEAIEGVVAPTHHSCAAAHPTLSASIPAEFSYILNIIARTEGSAGEGLTVSTTASKLDVYGDVTEISTIIDNRTYQSFLMGFGYAYVVFGQAGGILSAFDFEGALDYDTTEIQVDIETGDMDFDAPADVKSIYRAALAGAGQYKFYLYGSTDRGDSWRALGSANIDNSEEELHFRLSGHRIALKIQARNIQSKATVEELQLNLKVVGESVIRGGN